MRTVAEILSPIVVALFVLTVMAFADASVPACELEDGSTQKTCYWDAKKQGNGYGKSFTSYNYGERIVYH